MQLLKSSVFVDDSIILLQWSLIESFPLGNMISITESVQALSARLPELAWKLDAMYTEINPNLLPRGLFNQQFEMTPQSCIQEIKNDLRILNAHKNERSMHYLASRVNQKINVLVRLCQMRTDKKIKPSPGFGVQSITTRQQWLETLRQDIEKLSLQQQALSARLQQLQGKHTSQDLIQIKADIGEIERRVTLARETLARATRTI